MFTGRQSISRQRQRPEVEDRRPFGLVQEILLEPRWDEAEFARIKDETVETLNRQTVNPGAVASNVFGSPGLRGVQHPGQEHPGDARKRSEPSPWTTSGAHYDSNFSPSAVLHHHCRGHHPGRGHRALPAPGGELGRQGRPDVPYPEPRANHGPALYFVDMPGSQQSQITVGQLGIPRTHPDFFANYRHELPAGRLLQRGAEHDPPGREGFTYGARSGFSGSLYPGTFQASSSVMSAATRESVEIFRDEIARYREGISEEDPPSPRRPDPLQHPEIRDHPRSPGDAGPDRHLRPPLRLCRSGGRGHQGHDAGPAPGVGPAVPGLGRMIYLVVGDAATQLDALRGLGLGDPILLDVNGRQLQ